MLAVVEVAAHPFDLVGVDVRRRHLHRGREVDDDRALGADAPARRHGVADAGGKFQFGAGKAFGRILQHDLAVELLGPCLDHVDAFERQGNDLVLLFFKDDLALGGRRRVVQVHDRLFHALKRLEGFVDQVFSGLDEYLDGDVVGDQLFLDQCAQKVEFDFGGRGKANLNLFETEFEQEVEEFKFLVQIHRSHQRLVAVAQVDAAPDRCMVDGVVRPLALRQINLGVRAVLTAVSIFHLLLLEQKK